MEPQQPDPSSYGTVGRDMADSLVGGRYGFGAFRHCQSVWRHTVELITESVFFSPTPFRRAEFLHDPEYWRYFGSGVLGSRSRFFKDILSTPDAYDPRCIWSLFWAVSKAEHDFVQRYLPFWSHEERLTGHLVSQVVERTSEFSPHWRSLDANRESQMEIWYADTATGRREALTGADLGLVVHARYGNRNEFFKVARLQAKKVNGSGIAVVDLDQVESLLARENLGYLLFYHAPDANQWQLAPTVSSASTYKSNVEKKRKERVSPRQELGKENISVRDHGFDFASFLTFALADPGSPLGRIAGTPREAVSEVMGGNGPYGPPDRLLVITLGNNLPSVDWPHAFGEYLGGYQGE